MKHVGTRPAPRRPVLSAAGVALVAAAGGGLVFGLPDDTLSSGRAPVPAVDGRPEAPPAPSSPSLYTAPPLVPSLYTHLGDRIETRAHAPQASPLVDHLQGIGHPAAYALEADPDRGMLGEEIRRDITDQAGGELRQVARRAMHDALEEQPLYQDLRRFVALDFGDVPTYRPPAGPPLSGTPDERPSALADRFHGPGTGAGHSPLDLSPTLSVGVNPTVGLSWMNLYRVAWEPRDRDLVHSLGYDVGPMSVGMEYRYEADDRATGTGGGLRFQLGRMSALSFSASTTLRRPEGIDDERALLAELFCRF